VTAQSCQLFGKVGNSFWIGLLTSRNKLKREPSSTWTRCLGGLPGVPNWRTIYGIRSETFYAAYQSGEEPENDAWVLDFGEWASVYRT
jgi:hypothetical protein